MDNYFNILNGINVNEKTEKKGNLTYLSWSWAWGEVKKRFPDATYTIYENEAGWNYHTDGKTCWVKTGVTVCGIEHIEYLPVMDYKNASIAADKVTSFDVNKAIQRSLTKAIGRHGLGLYIYAGEDLPEGETPPPKPRCVRCGKEITGVQFRSGTSCTAEQIVQISREKLNTDLCWHCLKASDESDKTGKEGDK